MTNEELPPPLPSSRRPASGRWGRRIGIGTAVLGALVFLLCGTLAALRLGGLIGVYKIPTVSMVPAINPEDCICVEGITYRFRRPARGEIIVFKGDKLPRGKPGERYLKRLVGLPGDLLRISDGTLYVNDQPATFRNKGGEIRYTTGLGPHLHSEGETFTVPDGQYFVLGDHSPNSVDSRMWGAIPTGWVTGRAAFCYSPSRNAGWIH